MSARSFAVDPKIEQYIDSVGQSEPAILARLRAETAQNPQAQMQIGAGQGQFMAMLAQLMGAKNYLELGVFTGYSSLVMALAMPEDGRVVALDVSEEFTSVARRYWKEAGVDHKIELRLAPAVETLDALLKEGKAETFDIAFIDADKVNLPTYFDRCLKLIRANGLILVDNVLWSGRVLEANPEDPINEAIRAFNSKMKSVSDVDVLMLPIGDGITMIRKK